jgi:hypothetical protein
MNKNKLGLIWVIPGDARTSSLILKRYSTVFLVKIWFEKQAKFNILPVFKTARLRNQRTTALIFNGLFF